MLFLGYYPPHDGVVFVLSLFLRCSEAVFMCDGPVSFLSCVLAVVLNVLFNDYVVETNSLPEYIFWSIIRTSLTHVLLCSFVLHNALYLFLFSNLILFLSCLIFIG